MHSCTRKQYMVKFCKWPHGLYSLILSFFFFSHKVTYLNFSHVLQVMVSCISIQGRADVIKLSRTLNICLYSPIGEPKLILVFFCDTQPCNLFIHYSGLKTGDFWIAIWVSRFSSSVGSLGAPHQPSPASSWWASGSKDHTLLSVKSSWRDANRHWDWDKPLP